MDTKKKSVLDKREFENLFLSHYQSLFSMGFKMSGRRELTKDCIQSLFLELWENRGRLSEVEHWNAYLKKSLYRKIASELKKPLVNTKELNSSFSKHSDPSYEELLINFQNNESKRKDLHAALNNLPEKERKVLRSRFYEGMSYDEIAETTGKSKQTVYNQIFSAVKRLKKALLLF